LPAHVVPIAERDAGHVYHLFPVRTAERNSLQAHLRRSGIDTLVHYPIALTDQAAFARGRRGACPVAERAARELLSLPLHPGLSDRDAGAVADAVSTFPTHHTLA
jgi:dTDP-4-amino-4,6-dideoxygalactose transaminase